MPEDIVSLTFRAPRAASDAITAMAAYFELSAEALIRRYVSAGLQQDEARYFNEQALATVEDVLSRNLANPELVEALMREARTALAQRDNPRSRPGSAKRD